MNIIEVKNLSFSYSQTPLLSDLSFDVGSGSFLAIAGPNGVGKSTLLNLLCASIKAQAGSITLDRQSLESYTTETLAKQVAVVRQEFVPSFGFSVLETVLMARTPYYGRLGFENEGDRQIVRHALEATDTAEFASRQLAQISGGERQRVFIARALAQQTPILMLDEPTSFLDLRHQVRIYDLLKQMQIEQNKTIIAITHDINLAAQYCDQVLLLGGDGQCYTGSPADILSPSRVSKVFGVEGFSGHVEKGRFFLPLGKLARDYRTHGDVTDCS
jgi:iron complex transport system ATP-binding protein